MRAHAQPLSATWNPLTAAKAQLLAEKPEVLQRMERTVEHCRVAKEHRKYRLDTLGEMGRRHEGRAAERQAIKMREAKSGGLQSGQEAQEVSARHEHFRLEVRRQASSERDKEEGRTVIWRRSKNEYRLDTLGEILVGGRRGRDEGQIDKQLWAKEGRGKEHQGAVAARRRRCDRYGECGQCNQSWVTGANHTDHPDHVQNPDHLLDSASC